MPLRCSRPSAAAIAHSRDGQFAPRRQQSIRGRHGHRPIVPPTAVVLERTATPQRPLRSGDHEPACRGARLGLGVGNQWRNQRDFEVDGERRGCGRRIGAGTAARAYELASAGYRKQLGDGSLGLVESAGDLSAATNG